MTAPKARVTVTIDPRLAAYAERLVAAGKASSVSAVVNGALESARRRDQRSRRLWREAAEGTDRVAVARMMARIDEQVTQLPPSHR